MYQVEVAVTLLHIITAVASYLQPMKSTGGIVLWRAVRGLKWLQDVMVVRQLSSG